MSKGHVIFAYRNNRILDIQVRKNLPTWVTLEYIRVKIKNLKRTRNMRKTAADANQEKRNSNGIYCECRQLVAFEKNFKTKEKANMVSSNESNGNRNQQLDYEIERAFLYWSSSLLWILDSGASSLMSPFKEDFSKISKNWHFWNYVRFADSDSNYWKNRIEYSTKWSARTCNYIRQGFVCS